MLFLSNIKTFNMKPLERILTIKKLAKELEQRGFSWYDAFYYLKAYNSEIAYPRYDDWDSFESYFFSQVSTLDDDDILSIRDELNYEIDDNNMRQVDENNISWRIGYYRVFISHLTKDKESAAYLKQALIQYGIDCFVAHEDIEPSKAWQLEIEKALFSMDLLCAIITPDFYMSKWCDQEVGIALGRAIPTISIKKGADPHGFIGRYQAIKAKTKVRDVAKDVFNTICRMDLANEKYFTKLGRLFINSKNTEEAVNWMKLINKISNFSPSVVKDIYDKYKSNDVLNNKMVLSETNKLFTKNDLIIIEHEKRTDISDNELPF